jgi:hypothetical protein
VRPSTRGLQVRRAQPRPRLDAEEQLDQASEAAVERSETPGAVTQGDESIRILDHRAEIRFGAQQRLGCRFAFGDVLHDAEELVSGASLIPGDFNALVKMAHRAVGSDDAELEIYGSGGSERLLHFGSVERAIVGMDGGFDGGIGQQEIPFDRQRCDTTHPTRTASRLTDPIPNCPAARAAGRAPGSAGYCSSAASACRRSVISSAITLKPRIVWSSRLTGCHASRQ